MFKKILLPTDGSEHSIRAAEKAIELAKVYNGSIDLIYVIDSKTSKSDVLNSISKFDIEKQRKERIQPIQEQVTQAGIDSMVAFLYGEPGPTIVEYANKGYYDIVILGSRGLNQLQTMVLGSVSHKVAKRVDCPVMIIK